MSENKRIEGSMVVRVQGSVVWVGFDTSKPVGTRTASGKSHVVARTLGLVSVEVSGRKFSVAGGLYEPIPKEDAYAAAVDKMAADLVATGMAPDAAMAFAKAHVPQPKTAKSKNDPAPAIAKAQSLTEGALPPAPLPVTPASQAQAPVTAPVTAPVAAPVTPARTRVQRKAQGTPVSDLPDEA